MSNEKSAEQQMAERKDNDKKSTFTVKAPNPHYRGDVAGVQFADGEGVVRGDNYAALGYFRTAGYTITEGGELPEDVEPAETVDRSTARDAVKNPDEAVSWGDRKSAKDYVDDTPETNGFGEDGDGVPVGARTPKGQLPGGATTHGEVKEPAKPRRPVAKHAADGK
jgi:hypothetical protein